MVSISVSKRKVYIIYSNMLTARIIRILRQKKITDDKSVRPDYACAMVSFSTYQEHKYSSRY